MAIRVEIEGKGQVAEFPDGTPQDVIDKVIKRDFFSGTGKQAKKPWSAEGVSFGEAKPVDTRTISTSRQKAEAESIRQSLPSRQQVGKFLRPILEGGGAIGGGILGTPSGPAGTVAGAALGYAGGGGLADLIEGDNPKTAEESALRTLGRLSTGATYEMGGQAALPLLKATAGGAGSVIKQGLGRLSGTGPGAVEEALKSGKASASELNPLKSVTAYDKALRGKINGEEIVEGAKSALGKIKDARATAYQENLQKVAADTNEIDTMPVFDNLSKLMQQYRIGIKASIKDGKVIQKVDTSRAAMGKSGRDDIVDTIEEVLKWEDKSPLGMDALKRRLDDFYSDSSQARQFVSRVRDSVRQSIVDTVPAYDEMTKGYSDATKLIKDIEADLSLRKQGMSGRVTADKALRRLMSSMRDNFELRKDLVDVLGAKGGEDLAGMVAGYSQSAALPRGLAGVGPSLITGASIAHYLDPWFASVLVASSPRVQGEFLRLWGKGLKGAAATAPAQKAAIIQSAIAAENQETQP